MPKPAGDKDRSRAKTGSSGKRGASKSSSAKKTKASRASPGSARRSSAGRTPDKAAARGAAGRKPRKPASGASGGRKAARGGGNGAKPPAAHRDEALLLGQASDDLFSSQILEELDFRHGIDVTTLDVAVRGGKATVRGIISDEDELDAIRETIGEMRAISDLSCLVQIAPERQERERDRARRVQEVLDNEPDLAAQNIQVAWVAQKAVLRGTAGSELHKAKAGLMALRIGGATHVRNRLVVTG